MANRRPKGAGCVTKIGETYRYVWTDAAGNRHKKSLRTKNFVEAKARAKEFETATTAADKEDILHQVAKARRISGAKPLPLSSVWDAFLKTKPTAGPGTLRNYKRAFDDFVKWLAIHYPAQTSFSTIPVEVVGEYLQSLWENGVSANTFNYRRNAVGLIVSALAAKYGMDGNPWHDPANRRQETKQRRKPLSGRQVQALLETVDADDDLPCPVEARALVRFLVFTGARLADAVNMVWGNVDMDTGRVEYVPAKTAAKGKVAEAPLVPALLDALDALPKEGDKVFPGLDELYHRNPSGLQKPLVAIIQAVTGDGRVDAPAAQRKINRAAYGVHSLRATFASQAAMAGCKPIWLARMLGDNIATVDKYYLQAGMDDTALAGFNQLPALTDGRRAGGAIRDKALAMVADCKDDKLLQAVVAILGGKKKIAEK